MAFRARQVARTVRDPLKMSRLRWYTLSWVIALGTTLIGGGFALAGEKILVASGPWVLYGHVPGGLHTHGSIMFSLGVWLIVGISTKPEPRGFTQTCLRWIARYYSWVWLSIWLAPVPALGGSFSYIGVILWGMIASLGWIVATSPPPSVTSRNETDLVRAVLAAGGTREQAVDAARRYFRGPNGRS